MDRSGDMDTPVEFASTARGYWSLLRSRCMLDEDKREFKVAAETFPCHVTEGEAELPDDFFLGAARTELELAVVGRRAIRPGPVAAALTPDSRAPSG